MGGIMRQARIKTPPEESEAVYHCISRTVNGEMLFDDVAKEVLRRQLWQVADYCGVQVITYVIMGNHFHVLLRVPERRAISDAELLRRYQVLYPRPTKYQAARHETIKAELTRNGAEAVQWRRCQLALMGDVSPFMKLLKQRFSIWYNKSHRRFGTLWSERFKSVLVESADRVLQTMAAYIDLNCVRAGLLFDPKEYRFCGYAEAVAGSKVAQDGIRSIIGGDGWSEVQACYRELIFGTGAEARDAARIIPMADYEKVVAEGGRLPLATVLRCRIRYFTDGGVLGGRAFVALQLAKYREKTGRCNHTEPRAVPRVVDWGDLSTLRCLRQRSVG